MAHRFIACQWVPVRCIRGRPLPSVPTDVRSIGRRWPWSISPFLLPFYCRTALEAESKTVAANSRVRLVNRLVPTASFTLLGSESPTPMSQHHPGLENSCFTANRQSLHGDCLVTFATVDLSLITISLTSLTALMAFVSNVEYALLNARLPLGSISFSAISYLFLNYSHRVC